MLKFRSICTTLTGGKIYNINGRTIREERLLSEGAYSFVYMAKDLNTNKAFTIKKTICQDKEKLEMANKEINVLKSLPPHKNIVQYYGSTIVSESNYKIVIMLMEFCERGNLLNIFEKHKDKIREEYIVKIMKDIISGLHFLHTQEIPIIHRDIKLENILCDKKGVYKICDLGSHSVSKSIYPNDLVKTSLYKLKEEIERDTTLMYRPPELIDLYSNLEISSKVDIWMLGCILYLLLFKIHPFQNSSFLSVLNGSFTIPHNIKCSKRIMSILLMTLNKNPLNRVDSTTLLFILENYSDLKKWFVHIPTDIKKRVNQIFDKINEINLDNNQNNVIEINNDKVIDLKIATHKYEVQNSKNNTNFLKFFTQNNSNNNNLKKKTAIDNSEMKSNKNVKNNNIEKKNENNGNNDNNNNNSNNNSNNNNDGNNNGNNNNNNKQNVSNVEEIKEDKKLEKNNEIKVTDKIIDIEVKHVEDTKESPNYNIINGCKENSNLLLNLDSESSNTIEHHDNEISYKSDAQIFKDLNLNSEIKLFDFNSDVSKDEVKGNNNFDNFFDPWHNTKNKDIFENNYTNNNDLFKEEVNSTKLNDLFNNENENFKKSYFSTNDFTNNNEQSYYKNSMKVDKINNSVNHFEEIESKEKNHCHFDAMLETKNENNFSYNSKNFILNDIKKKKNSKLIVPDTNDKFSELLDEFQKFSIQ